MIQDITNFNIGKDAFDWEAGCPTLTNDSIKMVFDQFCKENQDVS